MNVLKQLTLDFFQNLQGECFQIDRKIGFQSTMGTLDQDRKRRQGIKLLKGSVEFIEEIPYDETRTYVKLIARNKLFYERISNRDNEHDFPPDFLN